MDTGDVPRLQSLFGGGLPQSDLVRTMKRLLTCLAFCASLSASAQGDNCTVLGIQDLTQMVFELKAEIDSLKSAGMTRDSVVGVAWRGELAGADLLGANLSDTDLAGADLSGADLTSANLGSANLAGADLSSANLGSANLAGADLLSANLAGAYLLNADLAGAYLGSANLGSAFLGGANLAGANLNAADLSGANLGSANLAGADLYRANLGSANLAGADLSGAHLTCLIGCPFALPSGYTCEPDPYCFEPDRFLIVED